MTYSSRKRDRYRVAVTAMTGLAVAGSLASTGWIMGAAAHDYEGARAQKDSAAARSARVRARYEERAERRQARTHVVPVLLRDRPTRTRTTTRYVAGATVGPALGGGGTVTSSNPSGGQGSSSSTPTTSTPPPTTHTPTTGSPHPVPQVTPPPPAPTSGS